MKNKNVKNSVKVQTKMKSMRLSIATVSKAERILQLVNTKAAGRNIKIDQLFNISLDAVTEIQIQELQSRSLTHSDRQEILRQKYSELHGPTTSEEFIGVTMTPAYFDFLKEHGHIISVG